MQTLRTYLVEDSWVFREALTETLDETPATVVGFAEDEASASAWLAANDCDLVVVDLWLRSGSGMGLLRWLHSAERPFRWVVLSSFVHDAARQAAVGYGADGIFDKANDLDELAAYCRTLAARLPPEA
jgi:DNA-binding NarL/FixJ family response regulator